jgi:CDP-paratose 2-epimerase
LEAFQRTESITGRKQAYEYIDANRTGDHLCYYSDLRKIKTHYPRWTVSKSLDQIFNEIVDSWMKRLPAKLAATS